MQGMGLAIEENRKELAWMALLRILGARTVTAATAPFSLDNRAPHQRKKAQRTKSFTERVSLSLQNRSHSDLYKKDQINGQW